MASMPIPPQSGGVGSPAPWSAMQTLVWAAECGESGELVVAGDALEARLFVVEGRIAWAIDNRRSRAFVRHLVDAGVRRRDLEVVVREGLRQRSPTNIPSVLVSWGLASRELVEGALRVQLLTTLSAIVREAPHRCRFQSKPIAYERGWTLSLEELLSRTDDDLLLRAHRAAQTDEAREDGARARAAQALAQRLADVDGIETVVVADLATHRPLAALSLQRPIDAAAAAASWGRALASAPRSSTRVLESVVATAGSHSLVAREAPARVPGAFIGVSVDHATTNLAMALIAIGQLTDDNE